MYDSTAGSVTAFLVRPDDVQEDGGTTSVVSLGKTKIPSSQHPVVLFGGELSLQVKVISYIYLFDSWPSSKDSNN